MHDVMRKRVLRILEGLPDEQLYQVVDYMEFLKSKYAKAEAVEPSALQKFAERVEDQMRLRSVAPRAVKGTMKIMSTATRVFEGLTDVGRAFVDPPRREGNGRERASADEAGEASEEKKGTEGGA